MSRHVAARSQGGQSRTGAGDGISTGHHDGSASHLRQRTVGKRHGQRSTAARGAGQGCAGHRANVQAPRVRLGVRHMQHEEAGALEECHRATQGGCCTYIVLCAGSSSLCLSLKCSVSLADGGIVPVPLVGAPHDSLLRPPRCAPHAKAHLRSGCGEASQGGTQQTAARKRLATGPQPSPQSGATGDSTGSPSPALDSSLRGTQLPSTRLKTSHHARLAGGAPSMAQTMLQKAKSLVSSGGRAHHTVLQSLPPEQFSSLIDSLRKVSDDFQGRLE